MASFDEIVLKNIEYMNTLDGFNIVIICCSSQLQADYWQGRLTKAKGSIIPLDSVVIAVEEDWPGGAGNALGTLYAYVKATKIVKEQFGVDVDAEIKAGKVSVGLFHTAGKGTRLAPLPGAENNNKPGVKLPANILIDGKLVPITILEAVIKQTGCYAKSRKGRLSVFWGDQIFIPTVPVEYKVSHHVDILCSLGPLPTEEEWKEKATKTGKLDSDPHLWMPMTLDKPAYLHLMQQKGVSNEISSAHYDRIAATLNKFHALPESKTLGLFGPVDVGQGVSWWDFGQLKLYQNNNLLLVDGSKDAELLKLFYGISGDSVRNSTVTNTYLDGSSLISSSSLGSTSQPEGKVVKSVVSNVRTTYIEAEGAILVNVTAAKIIAKPGSIVYNVAYDGPELIVEAGEVLAGVFSDDESLLVIKSHISIDGGKAWEKAVQGNPHSFEEVYNNNSKADPTILEPTGLDNNAEYNGVAASGDSRYSYLTTTNGYIWKSSDYGVSYSKATTFVKSWADIATSGTGQYVVAVAPVSTGGKTTIARSSDYGFTWKTATVTSTLSYITISENGRYVYTVSFNAIYVSGDYGATFKRANAADAFVDITTDKTGRYAYAPSEESFAIWKTSDYGVTWKQVAFPSSAAPGALVSVTTTSNGKTVYAIVSTGQNSSKLFKSTDGGSSYKLVQSIPHALWTVSVNQNGKVIYLGSGLFTAGPLYVSYDGTESPLAIVDLGDYGNSHIYYSVAVSNSGKKIIAVGDYNVYVFD
eukprot:gene18919-24723_t